MKNNFLMFAGEMIVIEARKGPHMSTHVGAFSCFGLTLRNEVNVSVAHHHMASPSSFGTSG